MYVQIVKGKVVQCLEQDSGLTATNLNMFIVVARPLTFILYIESGKNIFMLIFMIPITFSIKYYIISSNLMRLISYFVF